MKKPEEILNGLSDEELFEVFDYIKKKIDSQKNRREKDVWDAIHDGELVKVVKNGRELWRGVVIKKRVSKVLVEKEKGRRYVVPPSMIELI